MMRWKGCNKEKKMLQLQDECYFELLDTKFVLPSSQEILIIKTDLCSQMSLEEVIAECKVSSFFVEFILDQFLIIVECR